MLLSRKPFAAGACTWPTRSRAAALRVIASDNGALAAGSKVKVVKEVKVFHAGSQYPNGLDLNGMEGIITKNVTTYNHKGTEKHLSANLPYQVQFQIDKGGKPGKLLCHLDETEIEAA